LAEVIGFIIEIFFRIVVEAIFEGIFYGLKKFWYWMSGQERKADNVVSGHHKAQEARRERIKQIRQKRNRKKR
jgi:hypothetical protein